MLRINCCSWMIERVSSTVRLGLVKNLSVYEIRPSRKTQMKFSSRKTERNWKFCVSIRAELVRNVHSRNGRVWNAENCLVAKLQFSIWITCTFQCGLLSYENAYFQQIENLHLLEGGNDIKGIVWFEFFHFRFSYDLITLRAWR